jgi:DMSO reductase family type II enzyme chaperone
VNDENKVDACNGNAAQRSAAYRTLAHAFTYSGAQSSPFGISRIDYTTAFDPSMSADACSLRGRRYTQEDQSSLFEELTRFYEFFGLSRCEDAEMPDHICVELEFMHFLTHLESTIMDRPEALVSVQRAQRDYLRRHLSRLIQGIRRALKSENASCVQLVETAYEFINGDVSLTERNAPG